MDDRLTGRQIAFIVTMILLAVSLVGWTGYFYLRPRPVPTDLARDAQAYLRFRKGMPLSEPLAEILTDPHLYVVETQPHALLGKPAPDFVLKDHQETPIRLSALLEKGPVVVVFYLGYFCDHCVAQLFGINEEIARFRELGAQVVALSPDSPETTAQQFKRYGAFSFPALSDGDKSVAKQFEVFVPAGMAATSGRQPAKEDRLYHATFVIGRDGLVHWANVEEEPFLHNKTLLHELARLEDRLPARPNRLSSGTVVPKKEK